MPNVAELTAWHGHTVDWPPVQRRAACQCVATTAIAAAGYQQQCSITQPEAIDANLKRNCARNVHKTLSHKTETIETETFSSKSNF